LRAQSGLLGLADAVPGDVDHALAVDAEGQGLAEALVAQHVADFGGLLRRVVLVVFATLDIIGVDHVARPRACAVHPAVQQLVVAGRGVFEQQRDVVRVADHAERGVVLALGDVQQADLLIGHDFNLDRVDVGQLVALGVDAPVVRVAAIGIAGAILGNRAVAPGEEAGVAGGLPPFVSFFKVLPGSTVSELGMELLEVVRRLHHVLGELPVALRHVIGADAQGLIGLPDDGVVIREFHGERRAIGVAQVRRDGEDLLVRVVQNIFPHELPIRRGVRLAIRPLQAFAHVHGKGVAIFGELIALDQRGLVAGQVGLPLDRRVHCEVELDVAGFRPPGGR